MANEVEKLNAIAIANIEKINGLIKTAIQAVNGLEVSSGGTAWTTTTAISSSRDRYGTRGSGSNSDFVLMGGYDTSYRNYTDEWNGSSWAAQSGMPGWYQQGWYSAGSFGRSSTDAGSVGGYRMFGGSYEYNGSSWSSGGSLNQGRQSNLGAGESTNAAFTGGGYDYSLGRLNSTEEYNGSSWSTANNMIYTTYVSSAMGALNDGMQVGGQTAGGNSQSCSVYDGTNWSSIGATIMASGNNFGSFGEATSTAHAVGSSGAAAGHNTYDGSSWSNATSMNAQHNDAGAGGSDSSGFIATGYDIGASSTTTACEEWT